MGILLTERGKEYPLKLPFLPGIYSGVFGILETGTEGIWAVVEESAASPSQLFQWIKSPSVSFMAHGDPVLPYLSYRKYHPIQNTVCIFKPDLAAESKKNTAIPKLFHAAALVRNKLQISLENAGTWQRNWSLSPL